MLENIDKPNLQAAESEISCPVNFFFVTWHSSSKPHYPEGLTCRPVWERRGQVRCPGEKMKEKKIKKKKEIKAFLIRRQNYIYVTLITTRLGIMFLYPEHFGVGVAFLTVGAVGLLMSWTTMDVGDSIKSKFDELNKDVTTSIDGMATILTDIKDILQGEKGQSK